MNGPTIIEPATKVPCNLELRRDPASPSRTKLVAIHCLMRTCTTCEYFKMSGREYQVYGGAMVRDSYCHHPTNFEEFGVQQSIGTFHGVRHATPSWCPILNDLEGPLMPEHEWGQSCD